MLVVLGCGNSNRSDDGVGVFVARELSRRIANDPPRHVRVFDAGTGGMDVMFRARGATELLVVDACSSGSEPGAVFRAPGSELESREPPANLHEFRWDHALFAGRKLFGEAFPSTVTVYLIEAASLDLGVTLSAAVATAADQVLDELTARVRTAPLNLDTGQPPRVQLRRGALYFDAAQVKRFFGEAQAVALLYREGLLFVLPLLDATAGGSLLKLRTPAGDRVVDAQEFLRTHAIDDWAQAECNATWDDAVGGVRVEIPRHMRLDRSGEVSC